MSPDTQDPGSQGRTRDAAALTAPDPGAVLVHPVTGEALVLRDAPTDEIADWRLETIVAKSKLDELASDLDVELARRLDYEGTRTARIGGFELTVQAPTYVHYDVAMLGIALEALVTDGRISRAVAERAIKVEVKRSANVREVNKLLAHVDPEVRRSVECCRNDVRRSRRLVSVKRA